MEEQVKSKRRKKVQPPPPPKLVLQAYRKAPNGFSESKKCKRHDFFFFFFSCSFNIIIQFPRKGLESSNDKISQLETKRFADFQFEKTFFLVFFFTSTIALIYSSPSSLLVSGDHAFLPSLSTYIWMLTPQCEKQTESFARTHTHTHTELWCFKSGPRAGVNSVL